MDNLKITLKSFGDLFNESISLLKTNFWRFIGLYFLFSVLTLIVSIVFVLPMFVLGAMALTQEVYVLIPVVVLLFVLLSFVLSYLGSVLFNAVYTIVNGTTTDPVKALEMVFNKSFGIFKTLLVKGFVQIGFVFFTILAFVLTVIFMDSIDEVFVRILLALGLVVLFFVFIFGLIAISIFMVFSEWIAADKKITGRSALSYSYLMVKNNFLAVYGRFLLFSVIVGVIYLMISGVLSIPSSLFDLTQLSTESSENSLALGSMGFGLIASLISSFIVQPTYNAFMAIFAFVMYKDINSKKQIELNELNNKGHTIFSALNVVGIINAVIIAFLIIISVGVLSQEDVINEFKSSIRNELINLDKDASPSPMTDDLPVLESEKLENDSVETTENPVIR